MYARFACTRARRCLPRAVGDNAHMPIFVRSSPWLLVAVTLAALAACSPAFNWRSVNLADAPLTAMLPCKPDQAEREVDWGQGASRLSMTGCEAEGATFAVSHMALASPADGAMVLERWQQALQKQLQTPQAASAGEPFLMPGALELPQSRRVQWQGRNAQGQAVYADALWFVRLEGTKARAYQALVLSAQPVPSAVRDTFVQGLQAR